MKKTFVISMLLLLSLGFAFAQGRYAARIGINFSNLSGDVKFDDKFGFHAGMMSEYKISPIFMVQPELLYTQRGARGLLIIYDDDYDDYYDDDYYYDDTAKYSTLLQYVELPIFLKAVAEFPKTDYKIEPYIGPELRYFIYGSETIKSGSDKVKKKIDRDAINAFDYGLGFGLDFRYNKDSTIGVRYSKGLAKPFKKVKLKNNAVMVYISQVY